MDYTSLFKFSEIFITRSFYSLNRVKNKLSKEMQLPILAYHEICDLPDDISKIHPYNVSPIAFEEQMTYLYEAGYSVIRLLDCISIIRDKKKKFIPNSIVLTFDDGYKNHYENAYPILKKNNFPVTIFLATDYINSHKIFPWFSMIHHSHKELQEELRQSWLPLSWEEVLVMSQNNISFGSHTASHTNIKDLDRHKFELEIKRSRREIQRKVGESPIVFSYPFSYPAYQNRCYSILDSASEILKTNGFKGACTTLIGTNSKNTDVYCLKRIQIKNTDTLFDFKAKIEGAYDWMAFIQRIYQKLQN